MGSTTINEVPIRSYADSNRELVESFERYMVSRSLSKSTIVNYRFVVKRFVEGLGPMSVVQAQRSDIRRFHAELLAKGQSAASLNARTYALRCFFKFLRLAGLVESNPMAHMGGRKLPKRLWPTPTIAEIEKLIVSTRDPLERAVVEVLYATGMRVSELATLRLENIDFAGQTARIVKGKGGKDRVAVFGKHAAQAMREYIEWRKPKTFLFEAPPRIGEVIRQKTTWLGRAYFDGVQRKFRVGKIRDLPTEEAARSAFEKITGQIHGFHSVGARPYGKKAIWGIVNRVSRRANIDHIHPHALRRAAATHMLGNDADIRYVQEFLGHTKISTTQIYTSFTANKLQEIYERCHPHAKANPGG